MTAVSMIDTTDQADEAEQLVEFLLSEEAQEYFAEETSSTRWSRRRARPRTCRRSTSSTSPASTSTSSAAA